jgi:hypothetical protein
MRAVAAENRLVWKNVWRCLVPAPLWAAGRLTLIVVGFSDAPAPPVFSPPPPPPFPIFKDAPPPPPPALPPLIGIGVTFVGILWDVAVLPFSVLHQGGGVSWNRNCNKPCAGIAGLIVVQSPY